MVKDAWADRFWTVIVFKDAATRGATEGLSFSLLLGLFYLFSKLLLTVTRRSQALFFLLQAARLRLHVMHRKQLMIDG